MYLCFRKRICHGETNRTKSWFFEKTQDRDKLPSRPRPAPNKSRPYALHLILKLCIKLTK